MLRIRLSRGGRKHQPHYRVVVADQDSPRDGRFVEKIGYFSPMTKPDTVKIEESRALYWLSVGAQPSDAVRRLLEKQGTFARLQRLHKGETFNQLMTEYHGAPWPPVVEAAPVATKKPSVAKPAAQNVVAEVFAQPAPEPVVTEATISAEPVVAVAEVVEQVSPLVIDTTPTDLTKIEGVGPKIAEILNNAGIVNYAQLANTSAEQLKEILVAAGGRYKMATPDTWPQQASLAVSGDWEALKQLQGELAGGRAV